jgi:transposase
MPNFIPYDPSQSKMVVINYADQLQPGTFEFAINHIIDTKLDLTIFHPRYKNEAEGRPAYDPAILLKIILFAYSKGITSSREIQWSCETNVLFKALSCDTVPHFTTLANFVSGRSEEIEAVFEQILLICDEQGLLGRELFAIDGCKMPSNAAKEWSGTMKELEQKRDKLQRQIQHHLNEHKKLDTTESRDDERRQRTQQTIETLDHAHAKVAHFLQTASPRMGQGKRVTEVKSNITDNESAKMAHNCSCVVGILSIPGHNYQQRHDSRLHRHRHGGQETSSHRRCASLWRRSGTSHPPTGIKYGAGTFQPIRMRHKENYHHRRHRLRQRSQHAIPA